MTGRITLEQIRRALSDHRAIRTDFPGEKRRASVALMLAGGEADLDVAMIRRAKREDDPWSGHMAFPGGRAEPGDADAEAVAERETMEEVGIRLERRNLVGPLDEMAVHLGKVDTGIVLSPAIYYVGEELLPFTLNGEVSRAYWVPLHHFYRPENLTRRAVERDGQRMLLPGIAFDGETIWGLTYRVLMDFSRLIGRELPDRAPPSVNAPLP